jgi:hypothetical protein
LPAFYPRLCWNQRFHPSPKLIRYLPTGQTSQFPRLLLNRDPMVSQSRKVSKLFVDKFLIPIRTMYESGLPRYRPR